MTNLDNKVLKKKKLDKDLSLRVFKNDSSERIFVEFSSKTDKLMLQRSFQDNYLGRKDAQTFEDSMQTIDDLKAYFLSKSQIL